MELAEMISQRQQAKVLIKVNEQLVEKLNADILVHLLVNDLADTGVQVEADDKLWNVSMRETAGRITYDPLKLLTAGVSESQLSAGEVKGKASTSVDVRQVKGEKRNG